MGAHTPLTHSLISFIFMQFSAKILENNRFLPQTRGVGVSAWEILDPLARVNTSDISASCLRCKFLFYD